MRTKKLLKVTALTALTAVTLIGVSSVNALAAGEDGDEKETSTSYAAENIAVDLTGSPKLTITDTTSKEIMFTVATGDKDKGVKINDTAWDVHEVGKDGKVEIDLSKLSIAKDNYVAIKSESTTPIFLKIGASIPSLQVKYNPTALTLELVAKKKANDADIATSAFEYRTAYGNWTDIKGYGKADSGTETQENESATPTASRTTFEEYQFQGATLYIRAKGQKKDAGDLTGTATIKDGTKNSDITYPFYDAGLMPGKEAKLNIKKQANGPKVSVDYVKATVNIPAKTEYRILMAGEDGYTIPETDNVSNATAAKKDVTALLTTGEGESAKTADAAVLEVRKAATADRASASKWTRVDLAKLAELKLSTTKGEGDAEVARTKDTVIEDGAKVDADGKIEITYVVDNKTKKATSKINIKSSVAIDVKIGDTVKTIKATKNATFNTSDDNVVYIRTAGVKADKTWAGEFTAVGKVKTPVEPEKPAEGGEENTDKE